MRLCTFFCVCILWLTTPSWAQEHTVAEQYLFAGINAERSAAGLPKLRWNAALQQAAEFHAQQMRSSETLSHQIGGEPDLTARAARAGAHFSRVAENVAAGQAIADMHDSLMRSPHHRENILDPDVDTIAIAVVDGDHTLWAVEDFAHDIVPLSFQQQESQVAVVVGRNGIPTAPTPEARATCKQYSGYVGQRPGFVMRYTTIDLERLPPQLVSRMHEGLYSKAAVGACTPDTRGFTSYNLAVLLYR